VCARALAAPYLNTHVVGQYMDKHLLIPLLQNLKEQNDEKGHFKKEDLLRAQMDVISKTNMVEYEMEFYEKLTGKSEMPAEMAARRDKVLTDWTEFAGNCGNLIAIVDGGTPAPAARARRAYASRVLLLTSYWSRRALRRGGRGGADGRVEGRWELQRGVLAVES
jgi:hypothetical protein